MAEDVKPKEQLEESTLQPIEAAATVKREEDTLPEDTLRPEAKEVEMDAQQAVPAQEAIIPIVSQDLSSAGVQTHHEATLATEVLANHPEGDVAPTGEHHPAEIVEGTQVTLPDEKQDNIFPPVMKTGELAKGNSAPLETVVKRRWNLLRFAKLPKILGGKKAA